MLVSETFPPDVNGVAKTLGRLVDTFHIRGHAVEVVRPRRRTERYSRQQVGAFALPFYPEVRVGLTTRAAIRSLIRKFKPNLMHIATPGPLGIASLMAAHVEHVPVVSSYHTNFDHYLEYYGLGGLEPVARWYLRSFHNRTLATLVPSEATRRELAVHDFKNLEIWSRGVDTVRFNPKHRDLGLRRSLGLGDDDLLLIYVGRLALEKGLPQLLAAYTKLRSQFASVCSVKLCLALVGGGPLEASLHEQQKSGVHLAGFLQADTLARWYASADIFAFPSLTETFGNVVLEAQASGLPVVAFESPLMHERVSHGTDALLAAREEDFAAALVTLCRDAELRRRMGAAARNRAEGQTWDAIFDRLETTYQGIANGP
jgi:glycosyltransferase involved in cell wall biosynthesis